LSFLGKYASDRGLKVSEFLNPAATVKDILNYPSMVYNLSLIGSLSQEDSDKLYEILHPPMTSKPKGDSWAAKIVKEFFQAPFRDKNNEVQVILDYIKACIANHNSPPYISLVQSSGCGKTRTLRELSRKVRTVYVNMRSSTSTGYPPRSKQAVSVLFEGLDNLDWSQIEDELVDRLSKCVISALHNLPDPAQDTQQGLFMSDVIANEFWNFPSLPGERSISASQGEIVLIVIDEARALLDTAALLHGALPDGDRDENMFLCYCRALEIVSRKWPKIFSILVDTSSRVANFAPSAALDPSARFQLGASRIYEPYILSGYFDALKPPSWKETENLELKSSSKDYLLAGRPLVAELATDRMELDFLSAKLNGGYQFPLSSKGALSHALCRLATAICPSHPSASELVANYMCTLLTTNVKRDELIVSYVAEPKLAIAAARVWSTGTSLSDEILPALQSSLTTGLLSQGVRGELVAQIILLHAFDAVCLAHKLDPGSAVPLVDVLHQLLPRDSNIDIHEAVPELLRHSKVCSPLFLHPQFS